MAAPAGETTTSSFPPLASGLALLLYGLLALYIPTYLPLQGLAATLVYVLAVLLLAISVGVTFNEASELWKQEALNQLGNGLAFLIPTGVLFAFTAIHKTFSAPWHQIAQGGAIACAVIAILFLSAGIMGLPTLLVRQPSDEAPETRLQRRTQQVKSAESLLIAVLSFGAAVIGLVTLALHLLIGK